MLPAVSISCCAVLSLSIIDHLFLFWLSLRLPAMSFRCPRHMYSRSFSPWYFVLIILPWGFISAIFLFAPWVSLLIITLISFIFFSLSIFARYAADLISFIIFIDYAEYYYCSPPFQFHWLSFSLAFFITIFAATLFSYFLRFSLIFIIYHFSFLHIYWYWCYIAGYFLPPAWLILLPLLSSAAAISSIFRGQPLVRLGCWQ